MKKLALVSLLLVLLIAVTACGGGEAKKGGMTVYAPADRLDAVKEGFGKVFEVTAADSALGQTQAGKERYAVVFADDSTADGFTVPAGGFLLLVDDRQTPIQITIRYQSGAKDSGAAVINTSIISGSVEVTNKVSFTLMEVSAASRVELSASALGSLLKDIEGK